MNCSPHPQVSSPCADDSVSVGQALGTRGDINFDENGQVNLELNKTLYTVPFLYEKDSASYVFEYLYIRTPDGQPVGLDIRASVINQSTKDFTVDLSGSPTLVGCILFWHVIVPDPLHICQGLVNQPQYAQIPFSQKGLTAIPDGVEFLEVFFPTNMPDNDWVFEALTIEYVAEGEGDELPDVPTPLVPNVAQVNAFTVVDHRTDGFVLAFAGTFVSGAGQYILRWKVGG